MTSDATARSAWAVRRGILWAMDLRRPAPPAADVPRVPARFAEVNREALAPLARAMELGDPSEASRRFETGRRCFAAWLDDEIIAYGWVSQGDEWVGELERRYRLPEGDAYIWQCATVPRRRRHGLYTALLTHATSVLRAEGARRAWIGTDLENEPSLRAFARTGFEPVVQVTYARLLAFGWMHLQAQRGAPSGLVADARRLLTAPHERAWGAWLVGVTAKR